MSWLLALAAAAKGVDGGGDDAGLVFSSVEYDFERVDQGERVVRDFRFENRTNRTLTVSQPIAAPDCTAVVPSGREVAAGATGVVRFACDTSAMSGDVERTATLHVSDVERRSVRLTMRGSVALEVIADPGQLYLGLVERGTRRRGVIGLRGKKATRLLGVGTSGSALAASSERGAVSVEVRDDAPYGAFVQELELRTSSKRFPVLRVPVAGVVVEKLPAKRWQ